MTCDQLTIQGRVVNLLEESVKQQEASLRATRKLLEEQQKVLEELCEKNGGHDFIRESDGDCHRSGWYYTCKRCAYFTK